MNEANSITEADNLSASFFFVRRFLPKLSHYGATLVAVMAWRN